MKRRVATGALREFVLSDPCLSSENHFHVRYGNEVADALAEFADDQIVDSLIEIAHPEEDYRRFSAFRALAKIGTDYATKRLVDAVLAGGTWAGHLLDERDLKVTVFPDGQVRRRSDVRLHLSLSADQNDA